MRYLKAVIRAIIKKPMSAGKYAEQKWLLYTSVGNAKGINTIAGNMVFPEKH